MKTLADLEAPAQVVKTVLEADLQKQCVEWARARGYWARKFSSMSQRSVPDYLFSIGGCSPLKFACEFKRPGKRPTDAQQDELEKMRKAGWLAFWCDSFETFKVIVFQLEQPE